MEEAVSMVLKIDDDNYQCRSFTLDIIYYDIEYSNGYLRKCSCDDTSNLCKHIFLVHRILKVPISLRLPVSSSVVSSSSAVSTSVSSSDDTPMFYQSAERSIKLVTDEMKRKLEHFKDDQTIYIYTRMLYLFCSHSDAFDF